ncbi:NAD(P)-dependent oxidoreductase [Actinoplanes sp. OR16]|uniref:dTDP-4-dehydrorhamnose reductase n=1 Tax=Actinoplanes sp. OR16 TaxID=946334 RepID=UPI000F6E063F|nr:dTDP-4-dehydrorhamnose reductase [Actinoplanes sp. OR16]BBH68011.1 NAD(P)-dependent oxidoreductase [Actinoplanes sp. OR16]
MRWVILGAGGMLGRDLAFSLAGEDAAALTRADLDISDLSAVRAAVDGADVVINAAAWTNVDGAETSESAATAVNGHAVAGLATVAGKRLIHISTDYVFDGTATSPIPENTRQAPINAYGRGKAVGEKAVLAAGGYVVRTAWLYGEHGPNFVRTMLKLAESRDTVDVVDDQVGPPTWSFALAQQLVALARSSAAPGAYHGTAAGATTWFGLARAAYEIAGLDPSRVKPTTSSAFVRPARRPSYSVLGHDAWAGTGVDPLPDWRASLEEAMPALLRSLRTE